MSKDRQDSQQDVLQAADRFQKSDSAPAEKIRVKTRG